MYNIHAETRTHAAAGTANEYGLSLAAQDPPDLVLLDINLPGIDGL
jgi:DNA-binding response OmpR family regulator